MLNGHWVTIMYLCTYLHVLKLRSSCVYLPHYILETLQ
jgi:hypothetical protein